MKNVQPGMLARIVRNRHPENLQAIVRVDYACHCRGVGDAWWVVTAMQHIRGSESQLEANAGLSTLFAPGTQLHFHDGCLRPLGGLGVDEMVQRAGRAPISDNAWG